MKASSHEKHSKQQWKKQKKSSDPWARSGRGLAGDMGLNFLFFWFFHGFLQFGQKPREHKKKSSDPWARSGLSTHKPKNKKNKKKKKNKKTKNQETKKPKNQKKKKKNKIAHPKGRGSDAECWVLSFCFFCFFWFFWFFGFLVFWFFGLCVDSHCRCAKQKLPGTVSGCTRGRAGKNQKTKKPRNQKTKKKKNKKKKKKKQDCTPQGEGVRCRVLGLVFLVFLVFLFFWFFGFLVFWFFGFLVFWFFGFLVCVWIAIADVPSRDCQALSVVALEARSIHYSTAMFAMT